jgi:hypothetical protein
VDEDCAACAVAEACLGTVRRLAVAVVEQDNFGTAWLALASCNWAA